jgi:hypothetical protein
MKQFFKDIVWLFRYKKFNEYYKFWTDETQRTMLLYDDTIKQMEVCNSLEELNKLKHKCETLKNYIQGLNEVMQEKHILLNE